MAKLDNSKITVLSSGLEYPEGPIHCGDGSIILVEIKGQRLSIIPPGGGEAQTIAEIPGGPNGAAVGKDGAIYICNDGGFDWIQIPPKPAEPILWVAGNQPDDYIGGRLQRVDPQDGSVSDVFRAASKREYPPGSAIPDWKPEFQLKGPDDLVVDADGGIWFSDYGKMRDRDSDITGIYYISPDRKTITQKVYPLNQPNGIALSPDGKRLYVALTFERKVVYYDVPECGVIQPNSVTGPNKGSLDGSHLLTAQLEGQSVLDSMAVDEQGNVYVATMLPMGNNPFSDGGISVISPDGEVDYIPIKLPDHGFVPLPSNICFGGPDMKTAFITCGGSGHLISMPAEIPGLKLNYNGSEFDASNVHRQPRKKAQGEQ